MLTRENLLACCDVPAWADAVLAAPPESRVEVADQVARAFTDEDVERALAAHPRIGERAEGQSTEAAWSRQEQGKVTPSDELVAVNRAYEDRFGRVFLICATGLTAEEVLAAARERLHNDDETEAAVVKDELRKIALLRLRKLL